MIFIDNSIIVIPKSWLGKQFKNQKVMKKLFDSVVAYDI